MKKRWLGGVVITLLSFVQPVQAQQGLHEGLWRFEIKYNFIGAPQHFPTYKVMRCVNAETPFPSISRAGQECRETLQGRFGKTFTWQVDCSTEWEIVQGMGRIHFLDDYAQGDVHVQVSNPFNPPQPILYRFHGERLGPCTESPVSGASLQ